MDLAPPKAKKHCRLPVSPPLPVILDEKGEIQQFSGVFNGLSVIVDNLDDAKKLVSMGYFGKGNLSRSHPRFNTPRDDRDEIIRGRQFESRKTWCKQFGSEKRAKKVIVTPDSDNESSGDYFTDLRPKYELDASGMREIVCLGLEEAFFLQNAVKCLNVFNLSGSKLGSPELWGLFEQTEEHFCENYVVYYYFRAKNWVVKPGIKFGGDFLLYKQGPPFFHASYVILIDSTKKPRRLMDANSLTGLHRLCETGGKELLLCQITLPEEGQISFETLSSIEVKEILLKRWISKQERQKDAF